MPDTIAYNDPRLLSFDSKWLRSSQKDRLSKAIEYRGRRQQLDVRVISASRHRMARVTWLADPANDLEARFSRLAHEWRVGTKHLSSITDISTHWAYQQIIGLGPAVLPFLFRELARTPDHWFWALRAITGQDPVREEDRGRVKRMAIAWLEWASAQGFKW
jgi:hypothetical protein